MSERFSLAKLKQRCIDNRHLLLGYPEVDAAELADYWPGGKENPEKGLAGWVECYAQLARIRGQIFSAKHSTSSNRNDAELEAVVRAAAERRPIPLLLSVGDQAVYPKSAHALAFLDALDAVQRPLVRLMVEKSQADTLEPSEVDALLPMARSLAQRTWAWVLLTPGVGLPFDDNARIEPPEWTERLLPEDLLRIYVAHRELHADAVTIMSHAIPRDGGPAQSRLSLSGFLAGYASEHGIAPSHVLRQWSLPESVAAALASAEAHRVAEANAKAKRGRDE